MQLRILGCSGGIGSGAKTTSILIDRDILIDSGTGVGDLSLAELRAIRHVFLTHSHLDHIAGLPLFLDSVFDSCADRPIQVYARHETISALEQHIFNWVIWPDFTKLPEADAPVMQYSPIDPGDVVTLGDRRVQAIEVCHAVPSLGYCIARGNDVVAISGDTAANETLWPALNAHANLNALIVEVSFANSQADLARNSGHYCPRTLAQDIRRLEHAPAVWVTAMKPGYEELIFDEVVDALQGYRVQRLRAGDVLEL